MNTHLILGIASVLATVYCFASWRKSQDRDFFWFMWLGILGVSVETIDAIFHNLKFPILLVAGPLIVLLAFWIMFRSPK
jgi:hypothetical protein